LKNIISAYSRIDKPVINMLTGEFFLQLINAAFFLFLNYYMTGEGYKDFEIAKIISFRFLAVMIFALPLGFWIKKRLLKPCFLISSVLTPLSALLIIFSIQEHYNSLLIISMIIYSFGFALYQIPAMPFILKNARKEFHSEAIASYFLTWSIAIFICGIITYFLANTLSSVFTDRNILIVFSLLGFISVYYVLKIDGEVAGNHNNVSLNTHFDYDWKQILKVTFPTLIIATGAGFTIPFINLFFLNVHNVSSKEFSALGAFSYLLVAFGVVIIPEIKRRLGYKFAITFIQSVSVVFLILMATTEYYKGLWFAMPLAMFFFIFRQPLMNVAGPITSELTMYYVGRKNREFVSALNAAIWSGSWFISSQIFAVLRSYGLSYVNVFLITSVLYIAGILWYYFLINDYNKRKSAGLIENE
jgi:predicted MFS family arabinose efflux permease